VRGEPIVCSPKDALRCFLGTDLDLLVCGNALLWKDQQSPDKKAEYLHEFELD
jgi:carbamoyltransferase